MSKNDGQQKKSGRGWLIFGAVLLAAAIVLAFLFLAGNRAGVRAYREKIELLRSSALTEDLRAQLSGSPAGEEAGQVVFISVCDGTERAHVFTGVGDDLDTAWEKADRQAERFLKNGFETKWVKADVVCSSEVMAREMLGAVLQSVSNECYRYGLAFDPEYKIALLEEEMNGARVYNYDDEETGLNFEYLNLYLRKAGRAQLQAIPKSYTLFRCRGWFCDEEDQVYPLYSDGPEYGRRAVEQIDADYVKGLITSAGRYLAEQVNPDGSFVYGRYPRFDNEIEDYNIIRHAGTLWSLVCLYRITGDETLKEVANRTIAYTLSNVVYADEDTAYLYERGDDEIKLGANGVAVIALSEYMDAFQDTQYVDVCRALGNGILTMMDQGTGEYCHVLNGDFTRKESYRTVYYDGEATFALCRLYGMTGEEVWLDAAKAAVGHFIAADYTQYRDHWVAYSMNEITRYVDDPAYYDFGLRNAQVNLERIRNQETTYHTYLELLMATFELYDRMAEKGIRTEYLEQSFSLEELLGTIYARADRMLNGFFYPEFAMYMENPQRVLNTFMVRQDGFRVRIDDVQHNVGGYYKYYKDYEKLVSYGMLDCK